VVCVHAEARVGFQAHLVDLRQSSKGDRCDQHCVDMDEDYFDDASDADFLALAQQVDPASNVRSNVSNTPARTVSAPKPVTSGIPAAISSTSAGPPRPETPKTNPTAPKVLRPGFNAIIVNTRQVTFFSNLAHITERHVND
jgi:hypothetical protein